jgi:hypothetical protein
MKAKTIAQRINKAWDMVREFAPSLLLLRATLRPFDGLVISETAGPQPAGADGEPFFEITVNDPCPGTRVSFTFRGESESVTGQYWICDEEGTWYADDPYETSLTSVYEYLRQLPRSAHSFRRRLAR